MNRFIHTCSSLTGFDPPAKLGCWGTLVSGVGLGSGLHFRPVPRVCIALPSGARFDPPAKLGCWGTLVSGVGLGSGLHFRPVPRVCIALPSGARYGTLNTKNIFKPDSFLG